MSEIVNQEVGEMLVKVVEKANADSAFRKQVLSDVYRAAEELTGIEIPKDFKINVVDGTGYHVTLVLPDVHSASDELSETELEAVAGGNKIERTDCFPSQDRYPLEPWIYVKE